MVLGYENFYAHPTSSFNEPVAAPDVEPDEGTLVQVCFSEAWLPLVLGALSQLQLQSTWIGDSDAVLLAQGRATNLKGLFSTPVCAAEMVDTPYWDDSSDVDDELPVDEQTWYGYVTDPASQPTELDFVEDATIWAFTGLIALSLGAVGIAPALAFRTTAVKFVLAYKNGGNVGDIIRFFVDGYKIYEGVDTGDGSITDVPIVPDQSLEDHQIYATWQAMS